MAGDPKSQLLIEHYIQLYRIFIYNSDDGMVYEAKQLLTAVVVPIQIVVAQTILESSQTQLDFVHDERPSVYNPVHPIFEITAT
jgi:hypothetical protein